MTLLYATGWDLCTSLADINLDGWTTVGSGTGTVDAQTSNGRVSGACLRENRSGGSGSLGVSRTFGTLTGQFYVGMAVNVVSAAATVLFQLVDSGTSQLDIRLASDGSLNVTRNGTSLGTAPGATVTFGTYHYYELGFVIAPGTGGSFTLKRDMTTVITASAISTSGTGSSNWTTMFLGGGPSSQTTGVDFRYDDMYVCDANGSRNNAYLGDIGVRAELANAAGSNSGFTRTGGSGGGNYTATNEKPNDGDTSYVSSSTVSTIDTYLFPALSATVVSVLAVVAKPIARKDDAGNRHITARYRTGGGSEADFAATDITLTSAYALGTQIQETNPVTASAWVPSDISTGEFGPKISS